MKTEIFIDSGAFISFLDRSDQLHDQTLRLFAAMPPRWCTSVLVVAETYSWFLHRLGEEQARLFRLFLEDLAKLSLLEATRAHHMQVTKKLSVLRGCKLTYVDASSLVWLEERRISIVWGTDQHLALEGARVMPGSVRT